MSKKWLSILLTLVLVFSVSIPITQGHEYDHDRMVQQLEAAQDTSFAAREILSLMQSEEANVVASPLLAANTTAQSEDNEIVEVIDSSNKGSHLPPTSYVSQDAEPDVKFTLHLTEGDVYLGKGVVYSGFTIDDKIPGPTMIMNQNDIVEIEVINTGDVPHGMSLHAAYTQTSKYLGDIGPNETKTFKFKATYPGVYMYHCAPGGHAIPMHTLFGQYGMMVVLPDGGYDLEENGEEPDLELFLIQHEMYNSGKDAIEGDALYVLFNGQIFRYVDDPIKVAPGDNIRIYFLNIGPNLISTFHLVGIVWDHVYWQGHPENKFVGGQTVLAGPSDSWVIDFRIPEDEGNYLMVTHAFGSTTRGAIGVMSAKYDHEEYDRFVLADGPTFTEDEMVKFREEATRIISPYEFTDADEPVFISPYQEKVTAQIIGNSFYPKVLKVPVGTEVEWVNEEVFTYFEGEVSGLHDVFTVTGPERFASPILGHGEKFSHTFTEVGEYEYICTPHPYMRGKVIVYDPSELNYSASNSSQLAQMWYALPFVLGAMIVLPFVLIRRNKLTETK